MRGVARAVTLEPAVGFEPADIVHQ
jgi:hypothetical protein